MKRRLRSSRQRRGFSLVEVTMALGIVVFALLSLMALIPIGMKTNLDSLEESHAVNLIRGAIADRRISPANEPSVRFQLPAVTGLTSKLSSTIYLKEDMSPTTDVAAARYRLDCVLHPPAQGSRHPITAHLRVQWPAQSPQPQNFFETVATFTP